MSIVGNASNFRVVTRGNGMQCAGLLARVRGESSTSGRAMEPAAVAARVASKTTIVPTLDGEANGVSNVRLTNTIVPDTFESVKMAYVHNMTFNVTSNIMSGETMKMNTTENFVDCEDILDTVNLATDSEKQM